MKTTVAVSLQSGTVSNTVRKKLLRTSEVDEDKGMITTPAYLIAQLGKNYANGLDERISRGDFYRGNGFAR